MQHADNHVYGKVKVMEDYLQEFTNSESFIFAKVTRKVYQYSRNDLYVYFN